MRRALSLLLAAVVLAAIPTARPALAQDDWSVRRDPFDRRLIGRYKNLLARNPNDSRALKKLVALYRKYRSLAKLIGEYEAAHQKKASFATAMVLGHLHLEAGESDRALARYEEAAGMRADDASVHVARGELYRRSGRDADATSAYEKALELSKNKAAQKEILRVLADLALGGKEIAAARAYFARYIALDPKDTQARIELADALSRHKLYKEAIEELVATEKLLKSDPAKRVEVIARIGAANEALGEDDAAIREYRRAMKMTKRGYFLRRELTERIVEIHRRRQDLASLITHYEKTWSPGSRGHMEWDVLARLYEETGNQEKAIEAFRKAVAKAPYELDTQRRLIALLEHSGREDEALAQYEAVIKVAPGEPRFQLELAERYWNRGQAQKAFALLQKIEQRFPFDAGVQVALADLYSQWGKEQEALQVYVRLTKIEPSEIEHLVTLGEQYFQRGQKDKAVATWKKIAARKTAESYARLGDVFAEHDMLDDALAMYTRAVKADPKNPARYRGRARVYERKKDEDKAIADWEQALELTGDKASDQPARREARKRIVALFNKARKLPSQMRGWQSRFDRGHVESGYFLVEAYLKLRKDDEARAVLEKILAVAPDDKEALNELVKVYKQGREWRKAIALLERLVEISPGREREFYNEIAELKTILMEDDEAIRYSEKALEKSPNDPVAHEQLGKTYEKMQRFDRAIESYKKTIELNPRNFRVYFRLSTLYIRNGDRDKAAELYRAALRKATDEQVLHRAGRKAIVLEEIMGTLGELERVVAPLAFTFTHKPIYRNILVEIYDRYVPHLVALTRSPDPNKAAAARAELERLGHHGLKPLLEALADEENPAQQRIAVSVLGYVANKGAAVPLVKLASEKSSQPPSSRHRRIGTLVPTIDWEVRVEALVAAGRLGDGRIIKSLVELTEHREIAMREAATFALGMTGDKAATPALLSALDNSAPSVRMLGCLGLANIGDRRHRKAIEKIVLDRGLNQHARAACAFALGYLGDPAAVPTLLETLSSGNEEVQRVTAWSLGRIGDETALPGLLAAYFDKGADVREAVAWALPRVAAGRPDRTPVHTLHDFPMKAGGYDRAAAVDTLIGPLDAAPLSPALVIGHEKKITEGLRGALSDNHTNRILRALADLDARDDGLALGPLTDGLDGAPAADRAKVTAALARIADGIAGDLEGLARNHRDPEVRMVALSVVAKTGSQAAARVLLAGIGDSSPSVRAAAMAAAARYAKATGHSNAELAEAVTRSLSGTDWEERRAAALQLRHFGEQAGTAALRQALSDSVGFVRQAAAYSLGELRRRDAVDALLGATEDDMPDVRLAAVEALVAIGDRAARERLGELAESDPDPRVRSAAAQLK